MNTFSVVFFGTPSFALPALHALYDDAQFDIALVVTQPDKPQGRHQKNIPSPVSEWAQAHQLPVQKPDSIRNDSQVIDSVRACAPDFLVVVAYGQILSQEILDIPTIAPINIHASLLPRWRGASPLQHTILHGDTVGGVTIQQMEKKLDAGPILGQESLTLDPRETTVTLHDKLAVLGARLLVHVLKEPLHPKPQDPDAVTLCHKLTRADGHIDVQTMTAEEIDRTVRALVPWPGVTCTYLDQTIKILETALEPTDDAYSISCKQDTTLYLVTVQPPGKKTMSGAAWARGRSPSSLS